ncbi:MAG: ABC transporter ATP-binding protein [Chromatiales bacterium]|nr:ABC transporter ATP-binding protein [Chromatiales bacterium]
MSLALEFSSVSKSFTKNGAQIDALNNISFSVSEREVFGFVGPNGAGKSTTIKVMLDVISDYKGNISIYGNDAHDASSRRGIAYVPESPSIYEQFTPLEILKMALRMYGIRRTDENKHCMYWLEQFSIAQNANRKIRLLSKGNVQRVALAHAMVVEPRLLVLDEPLSGLDPVGRKDVVNILQDYKQSGGAIFFTSHVLHDVERIADRFGFINHGKLVTTRSPRELVTEHSDRFIVRFHATQQPDNVARTLREGEYEQDISQSEMPAWLDRLNQQGGHIINIQPATSLESVFFQILGEQGMKTI